MPVASPRVKDSVLQPKLLDRAGRRPGSMAHLIGGQDVHVLVGKGCDALTLGGLKVVPHASVVREHRGRRADLSTHVANCCHTGARHRLNSRAIVLHDRASASLDSQNTCTEAAMQGYSPSRYLWCKSFVPADGSAQDWVAQFLSHGQASEESSSQRAGSVQCIAMCMGQQLHTY